MTTMWMATRARPLARVEIDDAKNQRDGQSHFVWGLLEGTKCHSMQVRHNLAGTKAEAASRVLVEIEEERQALIKKLLDLDVESKRVRDLLTAP